MMRGFSIIIIWEDCSILRNQPTNPDKHNTKHSFIISCMDSSPWTRWCLFCNKHIYIYDTQRHVKHILSICLIIHNLAISSAGVCVHNWTNCIWMMVGTQISRAGRPSLRVIFPDRVIASLIWINVGNQGSNLDHQSLKVISPDRVITSLIIHEVFL